MREEKASLSMKLDTKDKVNWTIEMLSFSTRMHIPYELYWFFSALTCMYLKGAHLKYSEYNPLKKFLQN